MVAASYTDADRDGFVASPEESLVIPPIPLLDFFVFAVMLSIGLRVTTGELIGILQNRALFLRTLLANAVLIPCIGLVLVRVSSFPTDARIGILLLAAIPGTPIALQFTRMVKARLAFAAAMTFVLSLVGVAMTPLAIEALPDTVQRTDRPIVLLIASIALYIALPLGAGLWVARRAPGVAQRLAMALNVVASIAFLLFMWETRLVRHDAFDAMRDSGTIKGLLVLLLLSMLIGWWIGGPDRETRRIMATSTGMRSVVVVLYVARFCFPRTNVYMIPIVYLSLMVPTNLVFHLAFVGWQKLRPS
jgi:BASS family bile acid:Na+ symporter